MPVNIKHRHGRQQLHNDQSQNGRLAIDQGRDREDLSLPSRTKEKSKRDRWGLRRCRRLHLGQSIGHPSSRRPCSISALCSGKCCGAMEDASRSPIQRQRTLWMVLASLIMSLVACCVVPWTAKVLFPWKQIGPSGLQDTTAFNERDDLLMGKSCLLQRHPLFFWRRRWLCKDCGVASSTAQTRTSWHSCKTLSPLGKCPQAAFEDFDEVLPQSASTHHVRSSTPLPIRKLTTFGVGKTYRAEYIQPGCDMGMPCFDMSRCAPLLDRASINSDPQRSTTNASKVQLAAVPNPLAIYAYREIASADVASILHGIAHPRDSLFTLTDDPNKACLCIVHANDVEFVKQQASWNGGTNHLVYSITGDHAVSMDKAFGEVHPGMAMVASSTGTVADVRMGYDIPLPLAPQWKPQSQLKEARSTPNRPILVSFKGSIQDTIQPYYQDRWLAAEFWDASAAATARQDEIARRVEVDVQCKHKTAWGPRQIIAPYHNTSQAHFEYLLCNSIFVYCPGGSGVGSYRFAEGLSAGAIPVVLADLPMPWTPEIDWEGCVVRTSRARIIDLPRLLGDMGSAEVVRRQRRCRQLHELTMAMDADVASAKSLAMPTSPTVSSRFLFTTLKVIRLRIKQAQERQREVFLR